MNTLNKLLVNESFIVLSSKLKNQNVFEILRVEERETIHSRFLAYLLDPNATHGIGTGFLEVFLLCLSEIEKMPSITIASLDLDMATVTPEWIGEESKKRIDVVVEIPYKLGGRLVFAIECKVNAGQGINQLADYDEDLRKTFTEVQNIYKLLLTRSEDLPKSGDNWVPALWQDLVSKSLAVTRTRVGNGLSSKMVHLLEDFKSVIESWSEDSDTQGIEDLCQDLDEFSPLFGNIVGSEESYYLKAKHREAYDRLAEYFNKDPREEIRKKFESIVRDLNKTQSLIYQSDTNNRVLRFWPRAVEQHPLSIDLSPYPRWTKDGLPMLFEIFVDDYKWSGKLRVRLALIVGPMLEQYQVERFKLIDNLRTKINDQKWKKWGKKEPGVKWAGIVAYVKGYEDIDQHNATEILNVYIEAAKQLVPQIEQIVEQSPLGGVGSKVLKEANVQN